MRRFLFLFLLAVPALAFAQQPQSAPPPSSRDVVLAADDAFGRRIGVEEVGLYTETEVRGFSLQSAGNYRIDGHYFVRATGPSLLVLDGTAIRVGVNGLRTDFAAPSGVLRYDLVAAVPGAAGSIEAGWWAGSGPTFVARLQAETEDGRLGVAGGFQLNPAQHYVDGSGGDYYAVGFVPRWSPVSGVTLTAIASRTWFDVQPDTFFDGGGAVPDRVRRDFYRGQPWMISETDSTLAGLMADVEAGGWRLGASALLSESDDPRSYFNLLTLAGGAAPAANLVVVTPRQLFRSWSGELFAARNFATGRLAHRVIAMARLRDSVARTSPGTGALLGGFADLDQTPRFAEPALDFDSRRLRDDVRQWGLGFGYRLSIGDRLEFRIDAQKVRYDRRVAAIDGLEERNVSQPWLYSGALTAGVSQRLTLFASYARGLEESGVAPGNAVNRGEVLPATLARQAEIGLRYAFDGGPSLIAGLFEIAKPLPGLRADGTFDFVGEVRHRGVELSLAGRLTDRLSIVAGATLFEARLSGEQVDRGEIGREPVGRPEAAALASLTWQLPWVDGLSLDGGVSWRGGREANRENSLQLPAYATFNAGIRQGFEIDGRAFTLRARVGNLFNAFAWNVTSSGLFFHNGPRTFALTLTGEM